MAYIPGTETLIIKGIGWILAHMTSAQWTALAHYAISHGVITTATAIATNPIIITGTITIGGIVWTQEKANQVNSLIKAMGEGDTEKVAILLIDLSGVLNTTIDKTISKIVPLLNRNYAPEEVEKIIGQLRDIAEEMDKIKRKKRN